MTEAKPIDRHQRWRLANPEKAKAQQERKRLRAKGLIPPYEKPPTPDSREHRKAYMRDWHNKRQERIKNDPGYAEKIRLQARARAAAHWERIKADPIAHAAYCEMKKHKKRGKVRKRLGLPEDAPPLRRAAMTPDERRKRNAEIKRRAYRLKRGIPLDAPINYRAKRPRPWPKKIERERAKRAAEIEAAKSLAVVKQSLTTEKPVCPDPLELQELFRRASKGEPPRPFPAAGRKRSVFYLRGAY